MKQGAVIALACLLAACTIEREALGGRPGDPGRDAGSLDAGADGGPGDGTDACIGCGECRTAVDCPGETRDEWGPCGGFSGPCDGTGTQSRDVHVWLCEGGACVESVVTETQSCSRGVEGSSCGSSTAGAWSECSYADDCVESGNQSREVTGLFCRSGECVTETHTENRGCTRSTGGDYCSEPDGCAGRCAFGSCATACIDCSRACPGSCSGSCEGGVGGCCKCDC